MLCCLDTLEWVPSCLLGIHRTIQHMLNQHVEYIHKRDTWPTCKNSHPMKKFLYIGSSLLGQDNRTKEYRHYYEDMFQLGIDVVH